MKLNPISWLLRDEGDLIALFGNARLVKRLNGKFELLGGTDADRTDAKEWCSLFLARGGVRFHAPPPTSHLQSQSA